MQQQNGAGAERADQQRFNRRVWLQNRSQTEKQQNINRDARPDDCVVDFLLPVPTDCRVFFAHNFLAAENTAVLRGIIYLCELCGKTLSGIFSLTGSLCRKAMLEIKSSGNKTARISQTIL